MNKTIEERYLLNKMPFVFTTPSGVCLCVCVCVCVCVYVHTLYVCVSTEQSERDKKKILKISSYNKGK